MTTTNTNTTKRDELWQGSFEARDASNEPIMDGGVEMPVVVVRKSFPQDTPVVDIIDDLAEVAEARVFAATDQRPDWMVEVGIDDITPRAGMTR